MFLPPHDGTLDTLASAAAAPGHLPPKRGRGGLAVVGLFAGIGGIELGLSAHGHEAVLLNELEPTASAVLKRGFPEVDVTGDVRLLKSIPAVDLVAAGFPCQDLSQAGGKKGIGGQHSGLVTEVFRLLRGASPRPEWLLLENVSYMLNLDRGDAMRVLTESLEDLGYTWAYRVVDARSFGVPQRRQRVVFVASRSHDPREVLFADDSEEPTDLDSRHELDPGLGYGFYWTEGLRGLGWAVDAVPTIKGGSRIGIPSPPAIWAPSLGLVGTPSLRDAERLQGFAADWTKPAGEVDARRKDRVRWQLVGNAVCVPMAEWVGSRLAAPGVMVCGSTEAQVRGRWPKAAWGRRGKVYEVHAGMWPLNAPRPRLLDFLQDELTPLSARATAGFLSRAHVSRIKFPDRFLEDLEVHRISMLEYANA